MTLRLTVLIALSFHMLSGAGLTHASEEPVLLPFCEDDMCGFMDRDGTSVIDPVYNDNSGFHQGLAAVQTGGLWGFVNKAGAMTIPPAYELYFDFEDSGIARVKKNGYWGAINSANKPVVPFEYDFISAFSGGRAEAKKDEKYGIVRANQAPLTAFVYVDIRRPKDSGPIPYKLDGKWGYLHGETGAKLTPPKFQRAEPFNGELGKVRILDPDAHKDNPNRELMLGKYGYVDRSGALVIPAIYDNTSIHSEVEDVITAAKDGRYYLFDRAGKRLCDIPDDLYVGTFKNGRAIVRKNPVKRAIKFGQIDRNCEIVTEMKYKSLSDFDGEYTAFVLPKRKSGFLEASGNIAAGFSYEHLSGFGDDDYAGFKKKGKRGIIDRQFKEVAKAKFDFIYDFKGDSTVAFDKNSHIHLVHKDGRTLGPIKKYHIFNPGDDYLLMMFCGQKRAMDMDRLRPVGFKWAEYQKCFKSEDND